MMLAVLGEVGVRRSDGTNQPLRGKPGRVLAALVARSGRPASVDTLIEVLWRASPPASARSALHVHLSSLRRFLAGLGQEAPAVVTRSGGYVLDLRDATVDAVRFDELVGEARLRRPDDPAACVALLEEALALWRGTPYACDGDPVDAPAAWRLDLLRLEAEELLGDALVAAERTWEAESLLVRLVVEEPFREVRWAILMVARYRAGRQRDALRTYQEARQVLADELGVDPGPLLQSLERAVLVHDGSVLGRSPIEGTGGPGVAPLPRRGPALVGRVAELERCRVALAERGTVVVTGPPGVGKTRLALEVAHTHPGAAAWADLSAVDDAGVVDALAAALGRPGRLASDLWGALRSGADHLVVLDNAEHVAGAVAELVEEIHRRAPGARVLVTTRRRLRVDGAVEELHAFPLPPASADADDLERHPAVQLFRQAARDSLGVRRAEGHGTEAVVDVCRRVGGLPLSIRLAAAAARARSLSELAGGGPDEVTSGVRQTVETSLDLLTPAARHVFVSMGPVHGDVDAEMAAALAGVGVDAVTPALTELVDHHLLHADAGAGPARFRLAEPIREVAGAMAAEQRREGEILDRLADHCLGSARATAGRLRDRDRCGGALERLLGDAPHHRRALDHLARTEDSGRALALVCALSDPWYVAGRWRERTGWLDLALAVPGPPTKARVRAMIHRVRGGTWSSIASQLGLVEEAECLARELGAADELAYLRYFRGMASWWLGDVEGALCLYRAALEHFDAIGAAYESFETMKFIGVALVHRGQGGEGIALQREALTGVRDVGAEFSVAHGLALLGHSHRLLGDDDAAFADLVAAGDVCRAVGSRGTTIHVSLGLAEIAADRGRPDGAFEHARAALELIEESENRAYEPWAWTIAARAAHQSGDHDGALGALRRGVQVLDHAPPGDAARLAREAAAVASGIGEVHRAARLLGAAESCDGPREIPFPSPAEEARWEALASVVCGAAGDRAGELMATGRRCTPAEAAGELLAAP